MFQDEARFGRLSLPQRCWAPFPLRPVVVQGVVREYTYAYAALAPMTGDLDWMVASSMNTVEMGAFLRVSNGDQMGKRFSLCRNETVLAT